MKKEIKIAASILCADFANLAREINKCEEAKVDMIHVDVMDGHFVPPITTGPIIVSALRPLTKIPIESHLMVADPTSQIDDFITAGSDIISIHVECYGELKEQSKGFGKYPKEIEKFYPEQAKKDIDRIHAKGKKVYLVVNPQTSLCFDSLLGDIDGVLIMSVNPGFAKQKFMPEVLPKLQELRDKFKGDIAIDGGINRETAPLVVKAGANVLATASYFFGAKDQKKAIEYLKSL